MKITACQIWIRSTLQFQFTCNWRWTLFCKFKRAVVFLKTYNPSSQRILVNFGFEQNIAPASSCFHINSPTEIPTKWNNSSSLKTFNSLKKYKQLRLDTHLCSRSFLKTNDVRPSSRVMERDWGGARHTPLVPDLFCCTLSPEVTSYRRACSHILRFL